MNRESFLRTILSQPSAPFREGHVAAAICSELEAQGVPYFEDPHGNLVLGVASKKEYEKLVRTRTDEPLRVFIAHMDHPGFHGVKWRSPTQLEVKWHGGSPLKHIEGANVWLADANGVLPNARFVESKMIPSGRALDSGVIELENPCKAPAQSVFGGFRFRAPVWEENGIYYTKAADDLVGAFCICSLAIDLCGKGALSPVIGKSAAAKKSKPKEKARFIGLLTRAEEVGYIGAIAHFELGWLKKALRPILCVSLETSRTLPGAEIGKGPVVRMGDRYGVFHPQALRAFTELAAEILPDRHQRRVMDGGTCEGTAAMIYGFPTVGISVPLGNYHNQSFQGGPDSLGPDGPAPEFVHHDDIAGLITLSQGLMRPGLDWTSPHKAKLKEFKNDLKSYSALMKSGKSPTSPRSRVRA